MLLLALAATALWWVLHEAGRTPRVAVETLVSGPVERVLAVSGRTATDTHSDIRSQVTARVKDVKVGEGDTVAAGDALVILDASQQNSRIREAAAALEAAILREKSAQRDRDRARELRETLSPVTVANAERDLSLAAAEVDRLKAMLKQAQLTLPDYRIEAPIAGVVLKRSVEIGDLVSPLEILMRLADTKHLHVEVEVDENYSEQVQTGQRARLQLTGRTDIASGVVSYVAADVDDLTGSLRVKLTFESPPEAQIGLTTVANILVDRSPSAVTVPRSAFVDGGSGIAVFVLREGRARLTPISFIDWPAERVEVTSGLTAGDRVVLAPEGIKDGQKLAVRRDPEASS